MEIERKFLVKDLSFIDSAVEIKSIKQGYISINNKSTIRVRISNDKGFITIKGKSIDGGISREEWEFPIPYNQANELLCLCQGKVIEKTRYLVPYQGFNWEVDIFKSPINELVIAEIELPEVDSKFTLPDWVSKEVTGEKEYYNSYISSL